MTVQSSPFIHGKLRLSVTGCCNLNCFYCHNEGQGHGQGSFMDPSLARQIADYVKRAGFRIEKLNLTGGEPLLHPQLDTIIQAFSDVTDEIRLNTNGRLLTKDRLEELIRLNVRELKIGIDSLWAQTEDPGIKQADMQWLEEIIRNTQGRCRTVLNMVVSAHNAEHIDEMIRFCEEHGIPRLKLNEIVELETSRTEKTSKQVKKTFLEACGRWRLRAVSDEVIPELGREEMVLGSGIRIIWCRSFCASRACGSMYTIIDAKGSLITCSKSEEKMPVDFFPARPHEDITADILRAQDTICTSKRRYLRDIDGHRILLTKRDGAWEWEKEQKDYWKTPEPVAFGMAARWREMFPGGNVLDLGAGLGRHVSVFSEAGFSVTALELSGYAADHIRRSFGDRVRNVRADMRQMPFADQSFDAVFAYHTVSHCDSYLAEQIISEIRRILKPGGEAFLTLCSKTSANFSEPSCPRIDDCTVLKTKKGPEFGVAHFYADFEDIRELFSGYELIRASEVTDLWYDGERHDSCHYHLLVRRPSDAE